MYRLHYTPDAASLVVRVVLHELTQPFESVLIDRAGGGLDAPAYRTLNPLGLIPVLETPDGPMFETAAILLWLADRHGALAPAPMSPDRAAFLKWYIFTGNSVHTTLLQLFYPERVAGPDCIAQVMTHASARMKSHLTLLDRMVHDDAPVWLSAHQPSILGHYIGMLARWLQENPPGHPAHFPATLYPALATVLRAHEARPAARTAAGEEGLTIPLFIAAMGA
jgi:glutathione S-transferase